MALPPTTGRVVSLVGHVHNFGSVNNIRNHHHNWETLLQQVLNRWKEANTELPKRSESESLLERAQQILAFAPDANSPTEQ